MKSMKRMLALLLVAALSLSSVPRARAMEDVTVVRDTRALAETELGTVVGIVPPEVDEVSLPLKVSLKEVLAALPTTLQMKVQGSEELVEVAVSWYCPGGYTDSNDFYYQFSPTWDMNAYPLSSELDVERDAPYISVYIAEPSGMDEVPTGSNRVATTGNATTVFNYVTGNMGLNSAAACGILANMYAESALNPKNSCTDTNGKTSYGLCQWNGSRYTNLKRWCSEQGLDYKTVSGQVRFLEYELNSTAYRGILNYLKNVEDSASGAYDAAYYVCYHFEQPAKRATRSVERGNLAKNTYWSVYGLLNDKGNAKPQLSDQTIPAETMEYGTYFTVKGNIYCSDNLTSVTAGVYNEAGELVTGKRVEPKTTLYKLSELDSEILFSRVEVGHYTYRVTATTAKENETLLNQAFEVTARHLQDATIQVDKKVSYTGKEVTPKVTATYGRTTLTEGKDYSVSCTNNVKCGEATCTVVGMGNYAGRVERSFTIEQTADETDTDKETETDSKTDTNDTVEVEEDVELEAEGESAAVFIVSGESHPKKSMAYGTYFTLKGEIASDSTMTSLTAGVYDSKGKSVTSGTVEKIKQVDLYKQLDSKVLFSRVPVGKNYTYRVTATVNGETTTLIEDKFQVTTCPISAATVSLKSTVKYNGKAQKPAPTLTYHGRTLKKDTDYTLSYSNNKKKGTATCTIKGKGYYTGTVKKTFKIT